ncbi:HAD domain-containing protein [Neisseria wadsworthii]|uniref:HAD domain-containing protein n=1 Tax=Neisseria wadsworthii TaxID=607711 RepID=UPI000D2FD0AA|nr:HAD domain-containing protein [Neisseria wadsworthii]
MVLFLDFDGVLHPWPFKKRTDCFSQVPVLEAFLNRPEYADIDVVVSSSWREGRGLAELQVLFSPGFGRRIVGATPVFRKPVFRKKTEKGMREREILAWLEQNGRAGESWLALDDLEGFFDQHKDRVFFCDNSTGLTEDDLPALALMLKRVWEC